MSAAVQTTADATEATGLPCADPSGAPGASGELLEQAPLPVDRVRDAVASPLGAIAQSGSVDQLRGYANAAIGETKLSIGLAVGSPELALLGIAQKALGQAQRYIGEAKSAAEADFPALDAGEPFGDEAASPSDSGI